MFGVELIVVEPGTIIKHDGRKLVVDGKQAVQKGRKVYLTQKQYDTLEQELGAKST